MDKQIIIGKTIFNLIIYGFYYNLIYYFLKPEIYQDLILVVYLSIMYLAGIIDTYIRPLEPGAKEEGGYAKYILFLFLVAPFLLILAIIENQWLFASRSLIISILGLIIYFSAALFVLVSRIQLGKQATGVLIIVDEHQLIDTGIYRYVRHPIYGGGIIGVIGFILVSQSIIVSLISFLLYFTIFLKRAIYEEKMLIGQFGDKYEDYISKTKRFVPFIY